MPSTGLVDIHQHLYSDIDWSTVATYKRGRTKINHILVSPTALHYVTGTGILPFDLSDHRELFCDIIFPASSPTQATSFQARGITGNNRQSKERYQTALTKYLNDH